MTTPSHSQFAWEKQKRGGVHNIGIRNYWN